MSKNAIESRQGRCVEGLYEDENGSYRFDGQMDLETFDFVCARLGRNNAPALLSDLYYSGSLDLVAHPSVVAVAWSICEHPEGSLEQDVWDELFRAAGYTNDGRPAATPTEPVTVYRGCAPDGWEGMSWTSDLAVARRFAHGRLRGRAAGHVYALDAKPGTVLAYIHEIGRRESEYVIDTSCVLSEAVRLVED
jgi:hypothetical protein